MLHDSQTDLVFLPMALRLHFPRLYKSLKTALETAHVEYQEIPHTESKTRLWVRDYMPITVDTQGDIAQFCYDPDYLRAPRYNKYKPDMALIWNELGITPFRYEDITLDGGNVITDKQGQVYMTDKIFQENDFVARKKLVAELKNRLDASAIQIVQWDKSDIYGHVDGIMAIADDGSLITDLRWEHVTVASQGPYFHERDRLASICDAITSYIMSIPGLIPPSNSEYHSPIVDTDGHIRITLDEFKQILDSDLDEETLRAILS